MLITLRALKRANSLLKSSLSSFTHTYNTLVEFWKRYQTNLIREY